jgi:hypothetical protein
MVFYIIWCSVRQLIIWYRNSRSIQDDELANQNEDNDNE